MNITGLWANDGGDKVTQDELRIAKNTQNLTGKTINRTWDGNKISVFGARNEVVSFNLTLEAASQRATDVSVEFNTLTGPGGAKIASTGTDPLNWTNRPIELFYTRYLKINGLSFFGYAFEESQIPKRFQAGSQQWNDRPDHDKMYPDPLVPMELVKKFDIQQGQNQSVWADIYIPKTATPGVYQGTVKVLEGGAVSRQIPVQLTVFNFALPDQPTSKTVINLDCTDIMWRYVAGNGGYVNWGSPEGRQVQAITDKYYQVFHRHKLSLLGDNESPNVDRPPDSSMTRLDGSLYTGANGYDGPGVGSPNDIYGVGVYGTWNFKDNQQDFNNRTNNWASWFKQNLPNHQYFLYLQDEPGQADWARVNNWAIWAQQNPGPGKNFPTFCTVSAVYAQQFIPNLCIPATQAGVGNCPLNQGGNNTQFTNDAYRYFTQAGKKFWVYNDGRPGVGSSMTEDDGVAFRTFPWAQFKMGIDRWFYWYANVNSNIDMLATATSWGDRTRFDSQRGMWGDHAPSNGNGLLVYPGTDIGHTQNSYGLAGPIASLRLKQWRRGIQDTDYLALAMQKNPAATKALVQTIMPKALWENTVQDVSWPIAPITWSSDPDVWEGARLQLAQIITDGSPPPPPPPPPTGSARVVSIDFVGRATQMGRSEVAGVIPKKNWNSAVGRLRTTPLALFDETGSLNGATVVWRSDNNWMLPGTATPGNAHMMQGYLDTKNENPTTVTVAGLPSSPAGYDVYVYVDGDNANSEMVATFRITAGTDSTAAGVTDARGTNFHGEFREAVGGGSGNYLKFSGIRVTGFTLKATPGSTSDNVKRAAVNGIQIVPAQ
jgi:hypothetical protein